MTLCATSTRRSTLRSQLSSATQEGRCVLDRSGFFSASALLCSTLLHWAACLSFCAHLAFACVGRVWPSRFPSWWSFVVSPLFFLSTLTFVIAVWLAQVDKLSDELTSRSFTVSCLHGEMSMSERELIMREFRSGSSRVLITTDVLARGIDVRGVSLVINFDLPTDRENYIHRIGRSGRYGRKGVAINFITVGDEQYVDDIREFYETDIKEMPEDLADLIQ